MCIRQGKSSNSSGDIVDQSVKLAFKLTEVMKMPVLRCRKILPDYKENFCAVADFISAYYPLEVGISQIQGKEISLLLRQF